MIINEAASYDTDTHVLTIGSTPSPFARKTVMIGPDQVDVISAHDVHLGTSAHLRATGSHGLVIIANHDFLIDDDAQIDVSNGGAGARTACPNGATRGQDNGNGAGGGGGFGDDGGNGGDGNYDGPPAQGGSQGKAELSFPTGFHGGCPGADGGTGDDPGGTGGKGGGALYVVAAGHILFNSSAPLNAGGSGGAGGRFNGNGNAGGGGGGSGGLLIVEAPHIMAQVAIIAANGGAGGEGSDDSGGGASGANASVTTARPSGGSGEATKGSDGGDGGSSLGTAGDSVTANADGGGGGGGGGVGFIRIRSSDVMFLAVSPLPS